MSKEVMISINPPHTDNIFSGAKTIEWRHKALPTGKYYCYETKRNGGCGKIVGEFTIWKTRQYEDVAQVCVDFIKQGCVSKEYILEYCKFNKRIAANFIVNAKLYNEPKPLSKFCNGSSVFTIGTVGIVKNKLTYTGMTRPPQSYCYVEELP